MLVGQVIQNVYFNKQRENDNVNFYNSSYGSYKLIGKQNLITKYMKYDGTINRAKMVTGKTNSNLEALAIDKDYGLLTNEVLSNTYGAGINDINYIMTLDNILEANLVENTTNTYLVKMDLEKSIVNYKNNIVFMNPQESDKDSIQFSKIELTITLNNLNELEMIKISEVYKIKVGGLPVIGSLNQDVYGEITEKYTYR